MVLESIQEIGYEWAWVGDEFGTERKLYWIDDLKIKNPGQRRAAARTSLLLTKVISNFSPLYLPMKTRSSSGILNWVRRQKRGSRKLHQSGPVRGGQSRASLDVRDHSYPDLFMRSARQHQNQKARSNQPRLPHQHRIRLGVFRHQPVPPIRPTPPDS